MLSDAGVSTLIIDPVPMFVERAAALLERVPGLKQVLTLGPVPEQLAAHARDVIAEADGFEPKPLVAAHLSPDHVVSITYTGGTTGKPKGVIGTARAMSTMTQIQLAEWEWPEHPRFLLCTPLSHAGAAFFVPTLMKGGSMVVLSKFDPAEVMLFLTVRESARQRLYAGAPWVRSQVLEAVRAYAADMRLDTEGIESKVAQVNEFSRMNQHPLLCTMEKA